MSLSLAAELATYWLGTSLVAQSDSFRFTGTHLSGAKSHVRAALLMIKRAEPSFGQSFLKEGGHCDEKVSA